MTTPKEKITPIRLRLELVGNHLLDDEKRMLMRYGESRTGESMVREILIPSDMPLHNLHYTIQALFGWTNSHLRRFILSAELYQSVTKGTMKGWGDLVGILFQPPSTIEGDLFWDDRDYNSGSIKAWLRKKYTGPYVYGGEKEHEEVAQAEVQALFEQFKMLEVGESFQEFMEREKQNEAKKVAKIAPLSEFTIEEAHNTIQFDGGLESLLERLEVDKVLGYRGDTLDQDDLFPVTDELIYEYDYGDDWTVNVTKYEDCDDLIQANLISRDELLEAERTVRDKYQPVCIYREGISLLEDVGGLSGFARFLGTIFESEDKEEVANARKWAKGQGWNTGKVSLKKML